MIPSHLKDKFDILVKMVNVTTRIQNGTKPRQQEKKKSYQDMFCGTGESRVMFRYGYFGYYNVFGMRRIIFKYGCFVLILCYLGEKDYVELLLACIYRFNEKRRIGFICGYLDNTLC